MGFSNCRRGFVLPLIALLALATSVSAQTGQIGGQVFDEQLNPVAGLEVRLEDEQGGFIASTLTAGGSGSYAFAGLADGVYRVRAVGGVGHDLVGEYYDDASEHDQDLATPLTISGGTVFSGIDFVLAAAGSISGTISGQAAGEEFDLSLHDALTDRGRGGTRSISGTGAYSIDTVPAGSYKLFVHTSGTDRARQWYDGKRFQSEADPIVLAADQDLAGVDLSLAEGTSISGTVSLSPDPGDGGATVQQIWIGIQDAATGHWLHNVSVGTDGSYTAPNLPAGTYVVEAQASQSGYVGEFWLSSGDPVHQWQQADPVPVDVGSPAIGIDFLLEPGRSISGHVFLESPPADGVQDPGEQDVSWASVQVHPVDTQYWNGVGTDSNGDYLLSGLPPGRYDVTVESHSYDDPFVGFWQNPVRVDVTAGDASDIDFGVVEDRVVSGKVFLDWDNDQVRDEGEPPLSVAIRAYDVATGWHVAHGAQGPGGSYSIGLESGTYRIEAEPHGRRNLLRENWENVFFTELATPVDVTAGDAEEIDFGMVPGSYYGTLRGRVVSAADPLTAIAGVRVDVNHFSTGEGFGSFTTDAAGYFTVTGLPPGSLRVWFDTASSNAAYDTDFVGAYGTAIDGGQRIDYPALLGDGTDLGDIELAEGGSISGAVYPPSGLSLPLPFTVRCESPQTGYATRADVGADGSYHLRGLAPGFYWVQTEQNDPAMTNVYYLSASASTFDRNLGSEVEVAEGVETPTIDLLLIEGGSITGRITADSQPVPDFLIFANLIDDPQGRGYWPGHTSTDANGDYRFSGLPSGGYEVQTDSHDSGLANERYPDTVVVTAPLETPGIDFALQAGARITGRVTRAVDDTPLVGVRVEAWEPNGSWWSDARTEVSGDYSMGGLPQGRSYLVRVRTDESGDPAVRDLVAEHYSDSPFRGGAQPVDVGSDPGVVVVSGIDFELDLGGSIAGTVTTEATGVPVANLPVNVHDPITNDSLTQAGTGQDGTYQIAGLPAGSYLLRVYTGGTDLAEEYWNDAIDFNDADPVTIDPVPPAGPAPRVEGIDFALAATLSISGTVTEDDGVTPIAGLSLWVEGPCGSGDHSNADGTYRLTGLCPGDYLVVADAVGTQWARADQAVDLTAGSVSGVDFALGPGGSILGNVVDDDFGQPLENVRIGVARDSDGRGFGEVSTDANGDYEMSGLPAGGYRVSAEPDERNYVRLHWYNSVTDATPVVVGESGGVPQDATGIDFRLIEGFEIRGLVYFDVNENGVRDAGEPGLNNVSLDARLTDGRGVAWAGTASDGSYVFHGVYPEVYLVRAHPQGNLLAEFYQDAFFAAQATPIDVTSADIEGIDISLIDGTNVGTLRGRVTGSGGLAGVDVTVSEFGTDEWMANGATDANGDFLFPNLPPGSYRVYFEAGGYNQTNGADYLSVYWAAGGQTGVIDPELQRIDHPAVPGDGTLLEAFDLLQGGSISGAVVPPPGDQLPETLAVHAENFETGAGVASVDVETDGTYHLRGLPAPATYRVYVESWGASDFVRVYYLTGTQSTFDQGEAIAVPVEIATESPGVDLLPWRGGAILGTVTRADTGEAVVNAHVATHLVNDPLGRGHWWGGASTAVDGSYEIRGLPAGEYGVQVNSNQPELANDSYPNPVAVEELGEALGIDFVLEAAGSIEGCVTQFVDPDVVPVVGMAVYAYEWDTDEWGGNAHTGSDGCYSITSLSRGVGYHVSVAPWEHPNPQFSNFIGKSFDDALTRDQASRVDVPSDPPGVAGNVNFHLELGGAISGFVRAEGSGDPLQNVWVCVNDFGDNGFGNCDTTDHNGFYIVRGLPEGSYRVDANPHPQDFVSELFDDVTDHNLAAPVAVAAYDGETIPITDAIDFDLAPAFRISGRVLAAAGGEGIPGLRVNANGIDVSGGNGEDTRQDGTYELRGLAAGHYDLSIDNQGTNWIRQQREVDLTAGSLADEDFVLVEGATISGRVYLDADDNGTFTAGDIPGANVDLSVEDVETEEWLDGRTTDEEGFYSFGGLDAGSYRVYLDTNTLNFLPMYYDDVLDWEQATPVEIIEVEGTLQDEAGIDFHAIQGYEIRGEVFYDANDDGVRQPADEPRLDMNVLAWEQWRHNWSWIEDDSTYVIHSLAPGDYQVMAYANGTQYASEFYSPPFGASWREEADVVEIVDADLSGIDISVGLGGGIAGTVYDRATDEPLAGVSVDANPFESEGPWAHGNTDSLGRYLIRGLPEGDYQVQASHDSGLYVLQYYDDALFWDDSSPVGVLARGSLEDPLATALDFYLDEGGAIEGTVTNTAGDPVEGAYIEVSLFDDPWEYFGQANTEADGAYEVTGLPPGIDLRLQVRPPDPYYAVWYDGGDPLGSAFEEDAIALTVTAGEAITGIDVAVEEGGSVAGRVTDRSTGAGVADVDISVDFFQGHGIAWDSTDANGDFVIGGLVPGRDVQLSANPSTGDYVPVVWDGGDGHPDWGNAAPISIEAGVQSGPIDLALDRGGYIEGTVLDGDGVPIYDMDVWVNHYDDGYGAGGTRTASDGTYQLGPMLPGDYRVEAGNGPYRHEYYDGKTDWNLADRVQVGTGTAMGIDFVLSIVPSVLSGPTPAAGERGSTVTGITLEVENLVGDPPHYCAQPTPDPPCVRLAFGGSGLSVVNPALDAGGGTLTFDLAIAPTATLGLVNVSVVNDQIVEDGVSDTGTLFEVLPAAGGDLPAPSSERFYVTEYTRGRVRAYGVADNAYLGDIDTCGFPYSVIADEDGSHLFVGCSGVISVIDTRLGDVGEEVAVIELTGWGDARVAVGSSYLYAYDQQFTNRVRVIERLTWEVRDDLEIPLSALPYSLYLDPTGRYLWVNLRGVQEIGLVDLQPASGSHLVLASIQLPANFNDLVFAPDGARAWVATQNGLFEVDTALAVTDPASALTQVLDGNAGPIALTEEAGTGRLLAFLALYWQVAVYDFSAPGSPVALTTLPVTDGWSGIYEMTASQSKLYLYDGDQYRLFGVELSGLEGTGLSTVRFDSRAADRGLFVADAMTVAPTPGSPPAGAPTLAIDSGSPAVNGAPFDVYVSGTGLTSETRVFLRGGLTRPAVELQPGGDLKLTFPALTPTGEYTLVATNPVPGGPESGVGAAQPLVVLPPAGYTPSQTVYFNRYTRSSVGAFRPDFSLHFGSAMPYPYAMSISPDGKTGFAIHYDYSEWPGNVKPTSLYDTTLFDLSGETPTWVATVPYTLHASAPPAVTPSVDDPDGVYAYVANRVIGDTIAVIDPATRAEVDLDDNPATESYPAGHPWFGWFPPEWPLPHPLAGINRIHLDDNALDRSLQTNDVALTPDGGLIYTANRRGSVSVVDGGSYQVVGEILHSRLTYANHVVITPKQVDGKIWVWVSGRDTEGRVAFFVGEAGVLDEGAWTKIVLPIQDEFPREVSASADGKTVWATMRANGVLLAMKTKPANWGKYDSICVTEQGTEVTPSASGLCSDFVEPIPGMLHPAEAVEDGLLYINNSYRNGETWVLDLREPPESAGKYSLITTLGLTDATYLAIEPLVDKPIVNAVAPSSGSDLGGDPVVIAGANFEAGATVRFGNKNATDVVVENAYTIRAVTPVHAAATVVVMVFNPGGASGTLDPGFTFETDVTPPVVLPTPWEVQALTGEPPTVTVDVRWGTNEGATSELDYRRVGDPDFVALSDAALVTEHLVVLAGLDPDTDYEYRVRSTDNSGNTAEWPGGSTTHDVRTDALPDTTPPVIISPTASPTEDAAVISWQTNEPADSVVRWDAQVDGVVTDENEISFDESVTDHTVMLSGLAPGTWHEYQVFSTDPSDNGPTASAILTFNTTGDGSPPILLAGPDVAYLGNDLVIVLWRTDEISTSFVNYGVSSVNEAGVIDVDLVTDHVIFLANLVPGETYYFQAGSTDPSGNTVMSDDPLASLPMAMAGPVPLAQSMRAGVVQLAAGTQLDVGAPMSSFTTPTQPDLTPPAVISTRITPLSHDRALIEVTTDEAASLRARYGVGGPTRSAFTPALRRVSTLLIAGLEAGTTYQVELTLTDPRGNATLVSEQFTTLEAPDLTAPVVSGLAVNSLTSESATVVWTTGEPADATVRFGPAAGALDRQQGVLGLATSHSVRLSGLTPGTDYVFEAASRDTSGNVGLATGLFTTPAAEPEITSVVPPSATQGASLEVAINGLDLAAGSTADFGAGVTVTAQTVNAAGTQLRASLDVAVDAPVGARQLVVTGGGHQVSAAFAVVDDSPPVIEITSPVDGAEVQSATIEVVGTLSEAATVTVDDIQATVDELADPITFEATVTLGGPGLNNIVVRAVDASGNVATEVHVVELVNQPPVALCQNVTVSAGAACTAPASVDAGSSDPDGDPLTLAQDPPAPYALGSHQVTLTVTDTKGAWSSCSATVTVVDDTPPTVSGPAGLPVVPDPTCHAPTPYLLDQFTATDNCTAPEQIVLAQSPAAGVDLGPGSHPVVVTATDEAFNDGTLSAVVDVHFDFDGFRPPIGGADATGGSYGDPVRSFKLQSTIPVKFGISCAGTPYLEGSHTLQAVYWSSETDEDEPIDATPQDSATTGNEFRLTGDEWHFNLDAQGTGMSQGQWQLMATLADGTQHYVWVQVK